MTTLTMLVRRAVLPAAVLAAVAGSSGCTAKISNLSMASVRAVDLNQSYTLVASDVTATTSQFGFYALYLGYFGGDDLSYYKAIADLLATHDADLITDLEVTRTSYWFVLGIYSDYKVRGNVWRRVDVEVSEAVPTSTDVFTLETTPAGRTLVSADRQTVHAVVPAPRNR